MPSPVLPLPVSKPRPLTRVVLFSVMTGLLYYGYYKWMIQDELKAHGKADSDRVWSDVLCLIPFVVGIALPLCLSRFDPDVPSWFAWFALSGVFGIYIVQFRLYQEINRIYVSERLEAPLVTWWLIVPGLNLVVGLQQIHFLSQYWARLAGAPAPAPVADRLPLIFGMGDGT